MKRIAFVIGAVFAELTIASFAGTIHGKANRVNGESVVKCGSGGGEDVSCSHGNQQPWIRKG